MKKILRLLVFIGVFLLQFAYNAFAQTTISTQVGSTLYTGGNGLSGNTGISFVIDNTNTGPINLTQVACQFLVASNNTNVTLWYHPTSISGAALPVTTANGWIQIATRTGLPVTVDGVTPIFTSLLFQIPGNTAYRFALQSTINIRYSGSSATPPVPSPSTFTSAGVSLKVGDVQYNSLNVGYSITFPAGTLGNTPRWFTGSITFEPALPCVSPPTPGIAVTSSSLVCPNSTFNLSLSGNSTGTGQTYQWQSSPDSIAWTDISGATSQSLNTSLTTQTYYRCVVTCSSISANTNGVKVSPRPLLAGGTYTINANLAASASNFVSFASALQAMSCGVGGPVIFNVDSNTYVGKLELSNIGNTSAVNNVVFNGNKAKITHTSDANDPTSYVLLLNNVNHITFNNFTFELNAASTKGAVISINNSNNNTIKNCKILGDVSGTLTTYAGIVFSGSTTASTTAANATFNTIEDNEIVGGYYGVAMTGTTATKNVNGNIIQRNKIRDFYFYGIWNSSADSSLINANEIYRTNRSTLTTSYGIYVTGNSKYVTATKNIIHDFFTNQLTSTSTSIGIFVTANDAPAGTEMLIANNVIYNTSNNGTNYGIQNSSSDGTNIYFNTISMDNPTATAGVGYGIYQITLATRIDIKNNNISINKGGAGAKYCLYFSTNTSTITSNNNNLYMNTSAAGAGVKNTGFFTSAFVTLLDWQTANSSAFDQNSVSSDPLFASANFLKPNSSTINNIGTSIAGIVDDITGASRAGTPDPGAYEFTPATEDAGISAITAPIEICPGTTNVTVRVKNYGLNTLSSVNVLWTVNGVAQPTFTYIGSIASGADSLLTIGTFAAAANTPYNLKIWTSSPNGGTDANALNDTVIKNNLKTGLIGTVTVGGVGANFASLTALAAELNLNGICGPVVVNVNPTAGPYVEQLLLANIKGVSATNTLTINGRGSEIRFNTGVTGNRSVIQLNGSDYVTIDSFIVMGYRGSSTSFFSWGISMTSGSDFNTIKNCKVYVSDSTTSTNFAGIVMSGSTTSATTTGNFRGNTIQNNELYGGYYTLTLVGTSGNNAQNKGNNISNNIIKNAYLYSTYILNQDSLTVKKNDISAPNRTTVTTFYGIYMSNVVNKSDISSNKIHDVYNSAPINTSQFAALYLLASDNVVGSENIFYNNDVYNIKGNGTHYGIYNSSSDGHFYYHNTIALNNASSTAGVAYGFYQTTLATNIVLKNNSFDITRAGSGIKYGLYFATNTTVASSDYNNIYVTGSGNVGFWNAVAYQTLANWRTANGAIFDLNSISLNPNVNGIRNNIPQAGSPLLAAGVTSVITTDALGNARSALPTIGAYEIAGDFSGPSGSFVPVLNTASISNYALPNFASITDPAGIDTSSLNRPRLYFKKTTEQNTFAGNTSSNNGWKYVLSNNTTSPFSFTVDYSLLNSVIDTGDAIEYFVVARDLLGNVSAIGAELNDDPNNIILPSKSFPAIGTNRFRIGVAIQGTINVGINETYKSLTGNAGVFEYINSNLLGGDVNIIVKSNLTETGIHSLNAFAESGGSNYKVSISPFGDTLRTISGAFVGGLIRINGADRVSIDGRFNGTGSFFKIENTTATSNNAAIQIISLGNNAGSKNITIRNATIVAGTAGNAIPVHIGGAAIPYSSGASNDNISILNNIIERGSVGIFSGSVQGFESDSLKIEGNLIGSDITASQLRLYGIAVEHQKNARIKKNVIKNIVNPAAQQAWGIACYDGFTNGIIAENKLEKVSSGSGAFGARGIEIVSNKMNENISIENNFVGNMTGGGSRSFTSTATVGIALINTGGVKVYNNSVNLSGTISSSTSIPDSSAAMYVGTGSKALDIRNNSFVNTITNVTDTSYAYGLFSAVGDSSYTDINYNNYYVGTGSQGVLGYLNGNLSTLAQLQTSTLKDLNSISGNPNYVSAVDLHAQGATLYQKGQNIASIGFDIDDQVRLNPPCIGADEFTPPANEVSVLSILHPSPFVCGNTNDSVRVVINNLGTSAQTGFNIKVEITGAVTSTLSKTYNKTLAISARDTFTVGNYNSNVSGIINITAYTELATDAIKTNDTIRVSRELSVSPPMPTANAVTVCNGEKATLVATNGASTYRWYDVPVGGTELTANDTLITPNLTANTKYWVNTSTGLATGSLKISEIDIGTTDMIEIQNLSSATLNTTGWKVIVSDSYTLINSVNSIAWNLPPSIAPGQVLYKTDGTTDNYWGNNLFWNPGAFPSFSGWAMILDNSNNVVDAVFMNWPSANIAAATIVYNTVPIVIGQQWTGNGINITTVAATSSVSRAGNKDNNNLSDFQIAPTTKNVTNTVLSIPYTTDGCTSDRTEVQVTIIPLPTGSTVTKSAPFQGNFNAGTIANPDDACLADTLTYELSAPTGFNVSDLGTTWAVLNPTIKRLGGSVSPSPVSVTGLKLSYVASVSDVDSTLIFTADVVNLQSGCDSQIIRYLKVNKSPVVNLGVDLTICDGTNTTLDAGIAGMKYLWSNGDTTQTTTVNAAGNYSVTVTNNAGCSSSDQIVVTSIPSPTKSLGADITSCAGNSVVLDAGNPGATYLWSTGATTQTITVTNTAEYRVLVTAGTCSTSDTINVNFNALPIVNLGIDQNICTSDTITLDAGNAGSTYLWSTGATTQTIKVNTAGTYSVAVTNANGCNKSDEVVITNKPAPDASFTSLIDSNLKQVEFNAVIVAGNQYSWNFGDPNSGSNTSSLPNPVHLYTNYGFYTVTLTVTNVSTGCKSVTSQIIEVKPIGISNNFAKTFNLYAAPNPFINNTRIEYALPQDANSVSIEVYDMMGRKVSTMIQDEKQLAGKYSFDFINTDTEKASGMYMVKLTVDGKAAIIKVMDAGNR